MKQFFLGFLIVLMFSGVAFSQSVYINGKNTDVYQHRFVLTDSICHDTSSVFRMKEYWDKFFLWFNVDTVTCGGVIPTMTVYLMTQDTGDVVSTRWAKPDTSGADPVLLDSMNAPGTWYYTDISSDIPTGAGWFKIRTSLGGVGGLVPDSTSVYTGQFSIYAR